MVDGIGHIKFILHLPTISNSGEFSLKDLPGSGHRIDVLCRSLAACFEWGPIKWPIMNLELVALIEEGICLRFVHPGPDLPKGEVAWARIIQSALRGSPPEFVEIESITLEDVIARELERDNTSLWALEETGTTLLNRTQICYSAQNSFIIGNHHGFDSEALKVFDDHSIYRVSLGRISYLTSHCVVAILSHLEEMIN